MFVSENSHCFLLFDYCHHEKGTPAQLTGVQVVNFMTDNVTVHSNTKMKLLFFVVACSKAIRRCNQESIDEGKGETTNAIYLYMLNIVFYTVWAESIIRAKSLGHFSGLRSYVIRSRLRLRRFSRLREV